MTKIIIRELRIQQLGYDMMGYSLQKGDIYTLHHLIIPKRDGGKELRWNCAVLCGDTSHQYLHLIELKDNDIFNYITKQMVTENMKGYMDKQNIRNIHNVLDLFEREHCSDRNKKGKRLIKEAYTIRRKV